MPAATLTAPDVTDLVEVRDSPVHGRGVCARRDLARGQSLGAYGGRRLSARQVARRDWDRELTYVFGLSDGSVIDGRVGGNALRWFDIERDEPFIKAMMAAEEAFWAMVRDGEMPEPDGSEQSGEALRAMFPRDSGAEIELPSEFIEIDERLLDLKEQRKSLDRRIEGLEQAIKAAMGDAATARCGAAVYSWKTSQRKAYTVEASEVRRFSRKGL